ncbi:unnamed protein product [Taenia asiatica]|uniref:Histone H2A n=1 Tax=Taenia asiatica TaxID=60517 RepID=A0A0R3WCD4_TAEAS|nr:unnamed protein product [Taenia asiatica]
MADAVVGAMQHDKMGKPMAEGVGGGEPMRCRGESERKGRGGKSQVKAKPRSVRAGVQLPVGRVHRKSRRGNYAERVRVGALVYLAAVLAGIRGCRGTGLAICNEEDLNTLLSDVAIVQRGALHKNIHAMLLPKRTEKPVGGKE